MTRPLSPTKAPLRSLLLLCLLLGTQRTSVAFTPAVQSSSRCPVAMTTSKPRRRYFESVASSRGRGGLHRRKTLCIQYTGDNDKGMTINDTAKSTFQNDKETNPPVSNRRVGAISSMFTLCLATTMVLGAVSSVPMPATATYSAYTHREQDWEERQKAGTIKISSARALRSQLAEIAPMNQERTRIFCPNGPTAAVSPLMENRCSDERLATPSVFGRSDDVMGNSIPGFSPNWNTAGGSSSLADIGGFPTDYGFTTGRKSTPYSIK
jgi:hypothetical protein